jgi:ADP-heptose:LPS heptosyltransferase
MRIVLTLPDKIGDFIMRQPLLAEVVARGHSMALVMRSFVVPLVPLIAPSADVFPVHGNPYTDDFVETWRDELCRISAGLKAWEPDLVVVGAYQRTYLDDYIVNSLPGIRSVGMSGFLYTGDAGYGRRSDITFTQQVPVEEDLPEAEKYEALCRAVVAESIHLPPPALSIPDESRQKARAWLSSTGLEPGQFWAVCAGSDIATHVRNWQPSHWAHVCEALVRDYGKALLFIGTPEENEPVLETLRLMGDATEHCVNICGAPPPLDILPGLLEMSVGYLGRDTGPMHMAAALGKPVVAVFGGGTWPRCIPAARTGALVTCAVPCVGCGWDCHLDESHCIRDVPVDRVLDEVRRATSGGDSFRCVVLEPDFGKLRAIGAEAGRVARARSRRLRGELVALRSTVQSIESERKDLRAEISELRDALQAAAAEITGFHQTLRNLQVQAQAEAVTAASLAEQLRSANQQIKDLTNVLASIRRSVFTRLLTATGIWRIFRSERPGSARRGPRC